MTDNGPLAGKVAVIMGASGSIGAATARRLPAAGARVVATYAGRRDQAEALVASLPEPAGALEGHPQAGHLALAARVEDSASLAALAEAVAARYGKVDILVNSAGFTRPVPHGDLDALDDALIDQMFVVNWRGQFATVRVMRALLEASGAGLIVNISSIAALNGFGSNIAYCAVKAGIDAMTKSLARALAPTIRVLAVSPGVVRTGFVAGRDDAFNAAAGAQTPLRRVGEPEDVARAVEACATLLDYSTGAIILVDGGRAL